VSEYSISRASPPDTPRIAEGQVIGVISSRSAADAKAKHTTATPVVRARPKPEPEQKREPTGFEKAIYERPLAKGQPDIYDGSLSVTKDIYSNPGERERGDIYSNDLRPPGVDIYKSPYEKYRPADIYDNPFDKTRGKSIYDNPVGESVIYDKEHKLIVETTPEPLPPDI